MLRVSEGAHRAAALQKYFIKKRYLVVITKDLNYVSDYFDMYFLYPSEDINLFLRRNNRFKDFLKLDKDLYKAKSNSIFDLYEFTILMGMHLSRMLYPYRDTILPNLIVNDEDAFIEWWEVFNASKY